MERQALYVGNNAITQRYIGDRLVWDSRSSTEVTLNVPNATVNTNDYKLFIPIEFEDRFNDYTKVTKIVVNNKSFNVKNAYTTFTDIIFVTKDYGGRITLDDIKADPTITFIYG